MSYQVKTFHGRDMSTVEGEINQWLKSLSGNARIAKISHYRDRKGMYVILLLRAADYHQGHIVSAKKTTDKAESSVSCHANTYY